MVEHDNKCERLVLTAASATCSCWHRTRISTLERKLVDARCDRDELTEVLEDIIGAFNHSDKRATLNAAHDLRGYVIDGLRLLNKIRARSKEPT